MQIRGEGIPPPRFKNLSKVVRGFEADPKRHRFKQGQPASEAICECKLEEKESLLLDLKFFECILKTSLTPLYKKEGK